MAPYVIVRQNIFKISKLKFDILQLQKDRNKSYETLGELVFKKTNESNVSNFTGDVEYYGLIEKVNKYLIDISAKDEEILNIKAPNDTTTPFSCPLYPTLQLKIFFNS